MAAYSRKGFTLIELLIVVTLIGLLAGISVYVLNGARRKQRDTKRLSDIQVIRSAFENVWVRSATYPVVATLTSIGTGNYSTITSNGFEGTSPVGEVFLQKVPVGPNANEFYQYKGGAIGYSLCFVPEGDTIYGTGNGVTQYCAHSEIVDSNQTDK